MEAGSSENFGTMAPAYAADETDITNTDTETTMLFMTFPKL